MFAKTKVIKDENASFYFTLAAICLMPSLMYAERWSVFGKNYILI